MIIYHHRLGSRGREGKLSEDVREPASDPSASRKKTVISLLRDSQWLPFIEQLLRAGHSAGCWG